MELENIILSEVREAQKGKYYVFPHKTQNKCSNIIRLGSHTNKRMCMGGIIKGKET
jgi:hypothetical protein